MGLGSEGRGKEKVEKVRGRGSEGIGAKGREWEGEDGKEWRGGAGWVGLGSVGDRWGRVGQGGEGRGCNPS